MKQILFSLILSVLFASIVFGKTGSSIKEAPLQIWTVGFPDMNRQAIMDKIAQKYGFEFILVGDCQVTRDMIEKVNEHNEEVKSALAKIHGQGHWEKFENEVASTMSRRSSAEKMVRQQPYMIAKESELEFNHESLQLITEEIGNDSFIVKAVSWELRDGEQKMIFHYMYRVNIKMNSVEQVETKGAEI